MRVFVSYNSRDQLVVEQIVKELKLFRPEWDAYFAPTHNTLGAYWIKDLGEQLEASDTILLFLGKTIGPWQEIEFYDAWHRSRGQGRPRILPILLDDTSPGLFFLGQLHRLCAKALSPTEIAKVIARNEAIQVPAPLWRELNPYVGLRAQGTSSAGFFFGREHKTVEILDNLRRRPGSLHILVGNSGVGKSSLVNAGVFGALRSQRWPEQGQEWPEDLADSRTWLPITLKPGETPAKELASAFAATWIEDPADREAQALKWLENFRNGSTLSDLVRAACREIALRSGDSAPGCIVLNVDQGEELYTRANRDDARLFARLISEGTAIPDLLMIASLRADYYGALQDDAELFQCSNRIDVPPLTASETEDVIRQPVRQLGATFATPEIIPRLAEATVASPGGMPLLSFMLTRAWDQMRVDDASEGRLHFPADPLDIARPLIDRAEAFLRQHPGAEDTLRRLFTLRLAHVPKIGEAVRRRARREECQPDEWRVATELAGEEWRLLTTSQRDGTPMAEVAHEALLRSWPRLTRWLESEREFLVWKGTLEAARQDHAANPGDGTLLMGTPLEKARDWLASHRDLLSREDRRFIVASLWADRRRKRQARAQEADLAVTRERARARLLWLVRGAIAAVVLVTGVAIFAGLQWYRAEDNLALAEEQTTIAKANLEIADEQTANAEAALAKAQVEIERRQIEWARYSAQKATEFLSQDQPDQALAMAVSAFPIEARDRWTDIDRSSQASGLLQEASSKALVLLTLRGHEREVNSAAFSPDGTRIVTASGDTARVWDVATGEEIYSLRGHEDWVNSAAFSPDGTRIVTASEDETARLWDAATGEEIRSLRGHESDVNSAAFSPDGSRIVTASNDGTARLWDAASGEEIRSLRGHEASVYSAVFSPDGSRIVTASGDKTARLWDAATGEEIRSLRGHWGWVGNATFSPDGTRIVTVSGDKTARVWDGATGEEIRRLRGHEDWVLSATFSPDGSRIVTASSDQTARLWDAATGEEIRNLRGHEGWVNSAVFSPDGSRIVTASNDRTARVWDAASNEEIRSLREHEGWVNSAVFSPDGSRIVTASWDTARLWDAASGEEIRSLRGHENWVSSAVFSPDGSRIVTASDDETARLWDAATGSEIRILRGHESDVRSAAFSPDGSRIVTASYDRTARLWDAATGDEIRSLRGHEGWVRSAAFSPDGTRIVTVSSDKTARVWDAATGEEIRRLRGHEDIVNSAVFSPDGSRIATASDDGTARLWDAATGKEVYRLLGHEDGVRSAAFSPDGSRIVTASGDTARLWEIPPLHDLVDRARKRVDQADVLTLNQRCALYLTVEGCQ